MNTYNLKGAGGFDSKFPFDYVVILQGLLSDKIVIIDSPLDSLNRTSFTNGLPFCNEGSIQELIVGKCIGSKACLYYC